MTNNLLYFPYIDIPQNNWTIKSILYWDKVGIIVPPIYTDLTNQFEQHTIELLQSDLVKPIFPYEYVMGLPNFENGFLNLIHQPMFNLNSRRRNFSANNYSRIHVQKFGDALLSYLVELGIAQKIDYQWFYVETKTARLLMLYLVLLLYFKKVS